jgi:hypothetical protein
VHASPLDDTLGERSRVATWAKEDKAFGSKHALGNGRHGRTYEISCVLV